MLYLMVTTRLMNFYALAKNNNGHKNLMKMISSAHNNFHIHLQLFNFKDLTELKDDVIAISGGKDSHLFELIKRKKYMKLKIKLIIFKYFQR